jgi:hypothetical protein
LVSPPGLSAWLFRNSGPLKIFEISIPVAALWFGALGGVISSLQGMFLHRNKWDNNYDLWHIFSGVVGATYGVISYLFLVVVVNAGTSTPPKIDSPVFALGAFAIGYAQTQFHAMMKKVFEVLFQPAKKPGDTAANQTNPKS